MCSAYRLLFQSVTKMISHDEKVLRKCGIFKYNCEKCITAMVFNHPIIIPLCPIITKCNKNSETCCFKISKLRQFAAILFIIILIVINALYFCELSVMCGVDKTNCLQEITQILYSTLATMILIFGNLRPKHTITVLEEWCTTLKYSQANCNKGDLVRKNLIYLFILIILPFISGLTSYMILRDEINTVIKSICLILSLHLQLAAMFRHAMIMTFIQRVYESFALELKRSLKERQYQETTSQTFHDMLQKLRKYYALLANNTMLITKSSSAKLFIWLVCVIVILGINIYNLVLAFGEGFASVSDMVVPFETYGLISLILYIITCAQRLSNVVSDFLLSRFSYRFFHPFMSCFYMYH